MKHIKLFEEFILEEVKGGVVICDNCGWEWKISDGGNDPYICHNKLSSGNICGHDNDPSMNEAEETYNDYPAAATKNAQMAIDWKEKHGRDEVDAGTAVGWARANQLANKEKISVDTINRMSAFNRHRKNSKIDPEFKDTPWKDRGYVAWLIWGGDEGVDWAMKKADELRSKE
jgi:hypothetical protein